MADDDKIKAALDEIHKNMAFLRDKEGFGNHIAFKADKFPPGDDDALNTVSLEIDNELKSLNDQNDGPLNNKKINEILNLEHGGMSEDEEKENGLTDKHKEAFQKSFTADGKPIQETPAVTNKKETAMKQFGGAFGAAPGTLTADLHETLNTVRTNATKLVNKLLTQTGNPPRCKEVKLDEWKNAFQQPLKEFDDKIGKAIKLLKDQLKDDKIIGATATSHGYTLPDDKARFIQNQNAQIASLEQLKAEVTKQVESHQTELLKTIQKTKFHDTRNKPNDRFTRISTVGRLNEGKDLTLNQHYARYINERALRDQQVIHLHKVRYSKYVNDIDPPKKLFDLENPDELTGSYKTGEKRFGGIKVKFTEEGIEFNTAGSSSWPWNRKETEENDIKLILASYTQRTQGKTSGILTAGENVTLDYLKKVADVAAASNPPYTLSLSKSTVQNLLNKGNDPDDIKALGEKLNPEWKYPPQMGNKP